MKKIDLMNIDQKEIAPGCKARFVHSQNMTFAYWEIRAGAAVPEHSHPHEQVVNVVDGEFELIVDGEKQILRPNSVAIIPPNARHSGRALAECKIIDVFYPVREDYR